MTAVLGKTQNMRGVISKRSLVLIAFVVAVVVALDQLTKAIIIQELMPGERIQIIGGWFDLTLTYNRGAAFGLLAEFPDFWRHIVLAVATLAALGAVLFFLLKDYFDDWLGQCALAMIIGGAFGNVIDRLRFGAVIDFLDVYYRNYHWPAFNVADSAICVGVLLLIIWRPRHA